MPFVGQLVGAEVVHDLSLRPVGKRLRDEGKLDPAIHMSRLEWGRLTGPSHRTNEGEGRVHLSVL